MNFYYEGLSDREFKETLINEIYDNMDVALGLNLGHTEDLHIHQTSKDMITRIKDEEKTNVSCFLDKNTAYDAILNATAYKATFITNWIRSGMNEFDNQRDYQEFAFSLSIDDDPVGKGFEAVNGEIHEIESPAIKVVLQRDFDNIMPFGFFVKTAYCDIQAQNAMETDLSYTREEIVDNNIIDFKDNLDKVAFKNADKYENVVLRRSEDPESREGKLKVSYFEPDCKYVSYITEEGEISNYKFSNDGRRKVSMDEIPLKHYKCLNNLVKEVKNIQYEKNNEHLKNSLTGRLEAANEEINKENLSQKTKEELLLNVGYER